jgi:hypothetical protein
MFSNWKTFLKNKKKICDGKAIDVEMIAKIYLISIVFDF